MKKVHMSVAVIRFDTEMHSISTPMNTRVQGHLLVYMKFHMQRSCISGKTI